MRGKHIPHRGVYYLSGSPPQVRGKLLVQYLLNLVIGITPAGAGKTALTNATERVQRDHPRRCGENYGNLDSYDAWEGSPPQVRGKRFLRTIPHQQQRITPAGAGKTDAVEHFLQLFQDHPRRCGENLDYLFRIRIVQGSPPQVRGKRRRAASCLQGSRITPAGAGKTALQAAMSQPSLDHPRRCGENRRTRCPGLNRLGSPPQVRGKLFASALSKLSARDHPRRCGENARLEATLFLRIGSPPQVRGKQTFVNLYLLPIRITPAGAGKTVNVVSAGVNPTDHPRRCGENSPRIAR